jgi:four helix bundle protein
MSMDNEGSANPPGELKLGGVEGLTLYQKSYDFLLYIYPTIAKMPKYEKFTLQMQIKNSIIDFTKLIIRANRSTTKKSHLYEADTELQVVKMLIRLAHDLRYIPTKKYEVISIKLTEIGKILGGLIKYAQQAR